MKKKSKAGWRINGSRVYKVKGKTTSRRKTYKTKATALKQYKKRKK